MTENSIHFRRDKSEKITAGFSNKLSISKLNLIRNKTPTLEHTNILIQIVIHRLAITTKDDACVVNT